MSKYRNRPTYVDGHRFASKAEARRYVELKLLERAGAITGLVRQVRFPLAVGKEVIGHYVADFVYQHEGQEVVEDVKGKRTDLYKWKRRHFAAQYGTEISEVAAYAKGRPSPRRPGKHRLK